MSTELIAGKYEVLGLIGRGGMGSVWEGRHTTLGTRVAIKFIEAEFVTSSEARARFDNEARAAAKIQSRHAIQIYDHGVTDDGKPYIVMERLEGEPLDKRLDHTPRMSLVETTRIIQHVCRALSRAHEHGIVHRDLKPENIFLVRNPDEDDEIAKVLDFGIAKIRPSSAEEVTSSTRTGAVLGTPYYMSPEQARGLRSIDHRSDLWALGIIAYRCVAGVLPFDGESVGDLLVKICTSPIPIPSHTVPGLPPAFDAWFARALERDPERRFHSAQELSESLMNASGMSMRRPASSQDFETAGARLSGAPATTPGAFGSYASQGSGGGQAYYPPQAAHPNITAGDFTASSPRWSARKSPGAIVAVVGAAFIAIALAAFGVVQLVTRTTATTPTQEITPPTAPVSAAPAAPSPAPPAADPAPAEPMASGAPADPSVTSVTQPKSGPNSAKARPGKGKPDGLPGSPAGAAQPAPARLPQDDPRKAAGF